ncbi:MAG: hypothetical protein KDC38_09755 [Planctomycetes bacterium]|nr:hypothetical protein [Planctomycetota bacterium]
MKPRSEVEALLTLLAESNLLIDDRSAPEAAVWTEQLQFEVASSGCPTMAELDSYVALREELGEAACEDPRTGRLDAHVRQCESCARRATILAESSPMPIRARAATIAREIVSPPAWQIAASILGVGFLVWLAILVPRTPASSSDLVARVDRPVREVLVAPTPSRSVLWRRSLPGEPVDIAYLPGEEATDGFRTDRFEIAVEHGQEILVFVQAWDNDCGCVRWKHADVLQSELDRGGDASFALFVDVTDHPPVEQRVVVFVDEELDSDAGEIERALCCLDEREDRGDAASGSVALDVDCVSAEHAREFAFCVQ